ncbi:DUF7619 domain-containing protein [Flavobacterium terrisoli]|uniref:DUF7619 domain-containing protein n=1 Tax=Flavobacterium terrisoli TaxID=3242195 RepID=UPI002543B08C|nr:T9SS type A sorting domain-containing protein [Flavobacterium buctense]
MVKKYSLWFCFLFGLVSQAQVINFPDANFKTKLTTSNCAMLVNTVALVNPDTNQNGEIEVAEALMVVLLDVSSSSIASLEGISNFANLQTLACNHNSLTALDVSMLNITTLECTHNQLTSLTLNNTYLPGTNFYGLFCSYNQLTTLDLGTKNIDRIDCDHNLLTNINASQIQGLYEGYFQNNQLASLDLADVPVIDQLDISNNPITSFAFPASVLGYFYCHDTAAISLDFSQVTGYGHKSYLIYNNPLLEYLNFKNGLSEDCMLLPFDPMDCNFNFANNPMLQYVCVDDNGLESNWLDNLINTPDVVFSSYCSFTPGGGYNTVTGNISLDLNGNGCDASDDPMVYLPIQVSFGNSVVGSVYVNTAGNFTTYVSQNNNITLTPQFQANYFTANPPNYTTAFTGSNNTSTVDFCIIPNGTHPDLEIAILPLTVARPGFNATYKIIYKNKGNQVQSGTVTLTFEDDVLDLITSSPATDSQTTNTLTWSFANFSPFQTREITITLNVNTPQESPAVNIGDTLSFNAAIAPSETDETPNNNQIDFNQTVVGSYDPNDKAVVQGSQISIANVGDYLHYIVRFQNTGTYPAENVVIKDMLSNKLNWNTLEMISSSHPFRSTLTLGNQLEVFYEGINLPPSSTDEPGSHGFISFKVKPKNNVVINNVISNTAEIYFDFNFPIVTNTVSTTVTALGTDDFNQSLFAIYPNPTAGLLNITLSNSDLVKEVSVYNTLGQKLMTVTNTQTIDVSPLLQGSYLITVVTDKGKTTHQFIKI